MCKYSRLTLPMVAMCCMVLTAFHSYSDAFIPGYWFNSDNGKIYHVTMERMSWQSAQLYARNHEISGIPLPGNLAMISSLQENDFILAAIGYAGACWIGATDEEVEGEWRWIVTGEQFWSGGVEGEPLNGLFNNWADGYPVLDGVRRYVRFQRDGQWLNADGASDFFGVIELEGTYVDSNDDGIPDGWEVYVSTPIPISDIVELQKIGNVPGYPINGTYVLTNNIGAAVTASWNDGTGFLPIGSVSGEMFSGWLDGQGYTITGLYIKYFPTGGAGLFGAIGVSGLVENLTLTDCNVLGWDSTGALAAKNFGTIRNCHTSGSVGAKHAAGLVGDNRGVIADSSSNVRVGSALGTASGLAYRNFGRIERVHSFGEVLGYYGEASAGGIVLYNDGEVIESYFTGTVSGNYAAGIAAANDGLIKQCYVSGNVRGIFSAGGIAALVELGSIHQCYVVGSITCSYSGGISYYSYGAEISQCYVAAPMLGATEAGGLVLFDQGDLSLISSSFWDVDITGQDTSAGNGQGLETTLMKEQMTYTDAGWDFSSVWAIEEGVTYPWLQSLGPTVPATEGEGELPRPYIIGGGLKKIGTRLEMEVLFSDAVGAVGFQWIKDGYALLDAYQPVLIIPILNIDDSGWYSCIVEDESKGLFETEPVQVIVSENLPIAALPGIVILVLLIAFLGSMRLGIYALIHREGDAFE